jgi:hypothetical protein
MKAQLVQENSIKIGKRYIHFPKETLINSIIEFNNIVCFFTFPKSSDLDWNSIVSHKLWNERCIYNPSKLFGYDYNGDLKWEFPHENIVGIGKIDIMNLGENDFISPDHYRKYIDLYKDKELIEVYAGDFRFVIDANTGEIYGKTESR